MIWRGTGTHCFGHGTVGAWIVLGFLVVIRPGGTARGPRGVLAPLRRVLGHPQWAVGWAQPSSGECQVSSLVIIAPWSPLQQCSISERFIPEINKTENERTSLTGSLSLTVGRNHH